MLNDYSIFSGQTSLLNARKAKFNLLKISKSNSPIKQISSSLNRIKFLQNRIIKSNRRIINQNYPVFNNFKKQKGNHLLKNITGNSASKQENTQRFVGKHIVNQIKFTHTNKHRTIDSQKENKSSESTLVTLNRSSRHCVNASISRMRTQKKERYECILRQKVANQQKLKAFKQQQRLNALMKRFRVKKSEQMGRISLQNFYSEKKMSLRMQKEVYRNTLRQKQWRQAMQMTKLYQQQQRKLDKYQQSLLVEDRMKNYIEDAFLDEY